MRMKLGLLGMWHTHAPGMVRQIQRHADEFELVACHDDDAAVRAERHAAWQREHGALRLCTSAEELLALPLDGVVVEGRVSDNLRWAGMALAAGRPVLLEKPAGVDLGEFRRLHAEAARRRLHLQMTYLFRYMPAVQKLRELVHAGELGEVYEFRGRLPKDRRLYDEYVDELGRYPGGIFFEMAGHIFDLAIDLLGPPLGVRGFIAHQADVAGEFVDHGLAVLRFPRAWAQIEAMALEVCPDMRRFEAFGSRGAAVIPNLGSGHLKNSDVQVLEVFRTGDDAWQRLEFPARPLQIGDLREFAAVVRGQKAPEFSPAHDLAVQQALLAACGASESAP